MKSILTGADSQVPVLYISTKESQRPGNKKLNRKTAKTLATFQKKNHFMDAKIKRLFNNSEKLYIAVSLIVIFLFYFNLPF